ncbi:hypothetical protein ACF1G0_12385 [Streptomyces sp. NPDC013953]|uniref:hypothetical protein n=1 Tax=Streptomyces sp. NPDC013953 TaxID=3364868 RepID=UPI0036FED566
MIYTFLTVHRPAPARMAAALAGAVGVPAADVDVADEDADPAGRNWDAPVLCGYRELLGDVALSWDVYVSDDAVPGAPDEPAAARRVAAATGTTVLYPATDVPNPSAYWAATPAGTTTRARLYASDDEEPVHTVDAVEAPVPHLPDARVELLPEVYRAQRIPVPATEAVTAVLGPDGTAPAEGGAGRARDALLLWERLVRRMAAGWEPAGRYPLDLYLEDLLTRDDLAGQLATLPPRLGEPLARAAEELDGLFRAHTRDDGGELLGRLTHSGTAVLDRAWWWHRRPVRLPWT